MATTKFDICSRALTRCGLNPITSFEDGTTEAIVAGREYEDLVESALAGYRWGFAKKQVRPTRLTVTPEDEWDYYWQLPTDQMVSLHAVKVGGKPIEFDRYEDRIACDAEDGVVIDITFRPDERYWPAYFRDLVTEKLEAVFMKAIKRDFGAERRILVDIEQSTLPKAKATDSQQRTLSRLPSARLRTTRAVG
jgi:hypothetical protein